MDRLNLSREDFCIFSIGKKSIDCYSVSGGFADAEYGDIPGDCCPYGLEVAEKIAGALQCVNPTYVEVGSGIDQCGYLVFDSFRFEELLKSERAESPNWHVHSGRVYSGFSTSVKDKTRSFLGGRAIWSYPDQDWSGYDEDYFWFSVEEIQP